MKTPQEWMDAIATRSEMIASIDLGTPTYCVDVLDIKLIQNDAYNQALLDVADSAVKLKKVTYEDGRTMG